MLVKLKKILLPSKEEIKDDIHVLLSEGAKVIRSFLGFVKSIGEGKGVVK